MGSIGKSWADNETNLLIKMLEEREIIMKMVGKEHRHAELMNTLSEDLKSHSFFRSSEQIKTRIKTLKEKYNKIKKTLSESGAGGTNWIFWDDMHELYESRPSANRKGIDSAKILTTTSPIVDQGKAKSTPSASSRYHRRDSLQEKENNPPSLSLHSDKLFRDTVRLENDSPECLGMEDDFDSMVAIPPKPSREGTFAISVLMNFANKNLGTEESGEANDSADAENIENLRGASPENKVVEADKSNEESERQTRKKRKANLKEEKEDIMESLQKMRQDTTEKLVGEQKKIQKKGLKKLSKILERNSLLLIQAMVMAKNSQEVPNSQQIPNQPPTVLNPLNSYFQPTTFVPPQVFQPYHVPYVLPTFPSGFYNPPAPFLFNTCDNSNTNSGEFVIPEPQNELSSVDENSEEAANHTMKINNKGKKLILI